MGLQSYYMLSTHNHDRKSHKKQKNILNLLPPDISLAKPIAVSSDVFLNHGDGGASTVELQVVNKEKEFPGVAKDEEEKHTSRKVASTDHDFAHAEQKNQVSEAPDFPPPPFVGTSI